MAAFSFCHTRGTAKNECGRQSASPSASLVRSATHVTWMPNRIAKYCAVTRSAMCAAGR